MGLKVYFLQNTKNKIFIFTENMWKIIHIVYDRVLDKGGQLADKKPKIQKLVIQKLFILVSTYGI